MNASSFSVRPNESVTDWAHRTVNGLVDHVLARKAGSRGGDAETVHLIRTTAKQLRALLRLLRPVIPSAVFKREDARLKRAADRFSLGRDRTVALKTHTTLADSADDADRRALLRLRTALRRSGSNSATLSPGSIAPSLHDLAATRRALLTMRIADLGWTSLAMPDTYRRARKRMKTAAKHPKSEALHHWRIAVKRLYYQLQWLAPLWPKRLSAMVPLLHDLEHSLGHHHDLAVLEDLLLPRAAPLLNHPSVRLLRKAIQQRSRHLKRHSCSLGEKSLHTPSRRFAAKFSRHAAEFSAPRH